MRKNNKKYNFRFSQIYAIINWDAKFGKNWKISWNFILLPFLGCNLTPIPGNPTPNSGSHIRSPTDSYEILLKILSNQFIFFPKFYSPLFGIFEWKFWEKFMIFLKFLMKTGDTLWTQICDRFIALNNCIW